MQKNLGGRPSKFDAERARLILGAISEYVPYRMAAQANGISERTFYYWLKLGERDMNDEISSQYSRFLQSLRKIEAERIKECFEKITSSKTGHRGCQWLLEHVFWRYFSSSAVTIELSEEIRLLKADISTSGCSDRPLM